MPTVRFLGIIRLGARVECFTGAWIWQLAGPTRILKSHGIYNSDFFRPGQSWKLCQIVTAFVTHVDVFGLYIVYCQTHLCKINYAFCVLTVVS